MKKIISFFFVVSIIVGTTVAQTQIKGTILEETGEGAIGANIVAEGTSVGTVTDFDGNFELTVPAGVKHVVVSYMGYKTVTVPVKPLIKITLESDAVMVQEVVVQGMVSQDKRLFTGASTKVDAENAKLDGVADVSRSLEGRAAGVSVQNVSGTFGTAPKIRVRGATSIYGSSKPLWVVDGVVLEDAVELSADDLSSGDAQTLIASAIAGLNADDIESFQILKDGSATSIYGARAMAGVIVVTTKKGSAGKPKLNYTAELTYRMIPTYNDYNICNSQEQMGIYQELEQKGWLEFTRLSHSKNYGVYGKMYELIDTYNKTGYGLENSIVAKNAYLRQAEMINTDWFKYLFNQTVMHNHALSFSTGTDKSKVYASMSVMHDPGWYKQSNVLRLTGNANASFDILKNLTVSIATTGSYRQQRAPGSNNRQTDAVTGKVSREFDINPFSYAMNSSRALDPETTYRRNYCGFNILDELSMNYFDITVTDLKFQGELSYKPIRGLEVRGLAAYRYQNNKMERNIMDQSNQARSYRAGVDPEDATLRDANSLLYTDPDNNQALPETVLPYGGIYTTKENVIKSLDLRATVSYNHGFANDGSEGDDHILNVFAGAEYNQTDRQSSANDGYGYQYDFGGTPYFDYTLFKQAQEENTAYYSNSFTYYRNLAFFAMATYSYQGRYTLNGTIRYEGSNKLGKSRKARWLPTWNVSAAWNAHEESWWRPTFDKWWTSASLKASYSLTADRGPASNSMAIFKSSVPYRPLSSVQETSIELSSLENSELTYEKKHELNIGVVLGFVDNRINFEFDWYKRNNYDLIGYVQTMGVGGVITKLANTATMQSSGEEFTLSTVNFKNKNFRWTTDLIFSHTKNKITDLKGTSKVSQLCSGTGYAKEGYPVRALFSIPFAGLTEEGLPTFYTDAEHTQTTTTGINMQEYRNTDYLTYEGSIDPTITGSFNNRFGFLNNSLELEVYFTYSFGNVLRLNDLCYVYSSDYSDLTANLKEMKNRWAVPGDEKITNIPAIASYHQYNSITNLSYAYSAYNMSTERVAKGDFIRLKSVSLSYKFPSKWFENQKAVSSFSVKFSATNLWLAYADKKLNGQDPEYYSTGGVSSPVPRQFTMSFRLGL